MSEEMKVDPIRAKALVEALQEVSAKATAAAAGRNVRFSPSPSLLCGLDEIGLGRAWGFRNSYSYR